MITVLAKGEFDPQHEFSLDTWVDLGVLSINKAVVYLWIGAVVTIMIGVWIMRFGLSLRPSRKQTTGESVYELVQEQIAEGNLPSKALGRWFPFVASLFLFIWVLNIIGFVPLPISNENFELFGVELPTWGIYAATSNLSVTLALALITFVATHFEGIRYNGARSATSRAGSRTARRSRCSPSSRSRGHLPVHAADLALRPALRQHARGPHAHPRHARPHLHLLGVVVPSSPCRWQSASTSSRSAIVVTIQAFVFALLSAIYIGAAIEPEH